MAAFFEKIWLNLLLDFALPKPAGSKKIDSIKIKNKLPDKIPSAPRNSNCCNKNAPRKNPTPLSVFLEPVNTAIHLKSLAFVCWCLGNSVFTLALADILFKSLAIPESACASITYATDSILSGTINMASAITCMAMPMCMVIFKPMHEPNQPPSKFVTMPKNS